ncbi:MAG: hypothetical protein IKI15_11640 [Lachnospiraceae bacterium]|nr:hypothetical protein [Lachnospiraceae bacterium]
MRLQTKRTGKRIAALLLCVCMIAALAACGSGTENKTADATPMQKVTQDAVTATPATEATPEPTLTSAPVATPTSKSMPETTPTTAPEATPTTVPAIVGDEEYDVLYSDAGETLQVSKGTLGQDSGIGQVTGNLNEVSELKLRYYAKGATEPSITFDAESFLADNKATFEQNAASFDKTLRSKYKGTILVKKTLLKEISLGGFGVLAIYEIAAYGETPGQIGETNDVYRYQVSAVWVRNRYLSENYRDITIREKVLYTSGNSGSAAPKNAEDYLVISHAVMREGNADAIAQGSAGDVYEQLKIDKTTKPSEKDLVSVIRLGRYYVFEDSGSVKPDLGSSVRQYFENVLYVDADGEGMVQCYYTYNHDTGDYAERGGEVCEDGTFYYEYGGKGYDVRFMSYTVRQIVAAMLERGAEFRNYTLNEKAPADLLDKVAVNVQGHESNGPLTAAKTFSVYSERAKTSGNDEVIGVIEFSDAVTYSVSFYLVREGKAVRIYEVNDFSLDALRDDLTS